MKCFRLTDEFLADLVDTARLALLAPVKLTPEERIAVCGVLAVAEEHLFQVPTDIEGAHQRWKDCKYVATELETAQISIGIDRQQQLAQMLEMTCATMRGSKA